MANVYYWIKVSDDFFYQKEMKKLRRIAGGDTYTIIYLKMLLLSAKQNNKLFFDGMEDTFAEELSLELDEDVENVKMTLSFLIRYKLIHKISDDEFELTRCGEMVGSLSDAALRKRRSRENKKMIPSSTECDKVTDECDKVTDKCDKVTDKCDKVTNESHHIEKEKDKEKDKDKDKEKDNIVSVDTIDLEINEIRQNYKGTKTARVAKAKLPKLIKQYGKEQLIRAIERYNKYVEKERNNGFKTLKYKNESTWWNGGYEDYLDSEYEEVNNTTDTNNKIGRIDKADAGLVL